MAIVIPPHNGWMKTMTACVDAGCTRHYAMDRGYIDIRDQRIDDSKVVRKLCKKRGHKALAVIAVIYGEPLWQCLESECLQGTGVNNAVISVGDIVLAQDHSGSRMKVIGIDDFYATLRVVADAGDGLVDLEPEHAISRIPVSKLMPYPLKNAV